MAQIRDWTPKLRKAIATERRKAGLSQRALSEELGESNAFIQKIESGNHDVSGSVLINIAIALGRDPSEFLHDAITDDAASKNKNK